MDNLFKTSVAVAGATLTYLFGGWSSLLNILLVFVVIDYISGVVAAGLDGKLSSKVGMRGIVKKVFIFVIVAVAHLVDNAVGASGVILSATIFFYLANESLSILENSGKIGIPIPSILKKAVAILNDKSESQDVKLNE